MLFRLRYMAAVLVFVAANTWVAPALAQDPGKIEWDAGFPKTSETTLKGITVKGKVKLNAGWAAAKKVVVKYWVSGKAIESRPQNLVDGVFGPLDIVTEARMTVYNVIVEIVVDDEETDPAKKLGPKTLVTEPKTAKSK